VLTHLYQPNRNPGYDGGVKRNLRVRFRRAALTRLAIEHPSSCSQVHHRPAISPIPNPKWVWQMTSFACLAMTTQTECTTVEKAKRLAFGYSAL